MRKVIVNSTPLISLSKINRLEILKQLYGKVYIPYAVYEEVCIDGNSKIGDDIFRNSDFLIVEKIKPLMDALITNGIYIDDKLYDQVIKITNEK